MKKDDIVRLRHILDAAHEIIAFKAEKSKNDIQQDRILTLALAKEIEIIGEAASKISDEKRKQLPGIPWRIIIGMRNRLVHAYDVADLFDFVGVGLFLEEKLNRKVDIVPEKSIRREIKEKILSEVVLLSIFKT